MATRPGRDTSGAARAAVDSMGIRHQGFVTDPGLQSALRAEACRSPWVDSSLLMGHCTVVFAPCTRQMHLPVGVGTCQALVAPGKHQRLTNALVEFGSR
jgi:hypothetical protein